MVHGAVGALVAGACHRRYVTRKPQPSKAPVSPWPVSRTTSFQVPCAASHCCAARSSIECHFCCPGGHVPTPCPTSCVASSSRLNPVFAAVQLSAPHLLLHSSIGAPAGL